MSKSASILRPNASGGFWACSGEGLIITGLVSHERILLEPWLNCTIPHFPTLSEGMTCHRQQVAEGFYPCELISVLKPWFCVSGFLLYGYGPLYGLQAFNVL